VNWSAADVALVPPGVVTVTSTVPAPAGEVAVICVALLNVNVVAAVAPNFTAVAPVKFVPVMVTTVPPAAGPLAGLTLLTVGALPALALKVRWKFVVPPSPSTADTIKKYVVAEVAAKETCDCAIPAEALALHATCVKLPGVPVTAVRIVS
jgi:hypothetical protein